MTYVANEESPSYSFRRLRSDGLRLTVFVHGAIHEKICSLFVMLREGYRYGVNRLTFSRLRSDGGPSDRVAKSGQMETPKNINLSNPASHRSA